MEHFEYTGFQPTEALRIRSNRALERILELTPANAKVNVHLDFFENSYHCAIQIESTSFPLRLEITHKLASMAIDKLELAVIRKLSHWKNNFFVDMDDKSTHQPVSATAS